MQNLIVRPDRIEQVAGASPAMLESPWVGAASVLIATPFGRTVDVTDAGCVGSLHEPIIILGGQQHKLALAAPRDFDGTAERRLDDLAGSVAQIGERKTDHTGLLNSVSHYHGNGYFS
jgi:hypothetical protein